MLSEEEANSASHELHANEGVVEVIGRVLVSRGFPGSSQGQSG